MIAYRYGDMTMATNVDKDVEELKREFADLKADMSKLTETIRNLYDDSTSEGRDRAREAFQRSRERARESVGAFEEEIGERPLTSIATAFGIGFIIGKLLDR